MRRNTVVPFNSTVAYKGTHKGTQVWNRLPNSFSNNNASQPFWNELKLFFICDPK